MSDICKCKNPELYLDTENNLSKCKKCSNPTLTGWSKHRVEEGLKNRTKRLKGYLKEVKSLVEKIDFELREEYKNPTAELLYKLNNSSRLYVTNSNNPAEVYKKTFGKDILENEVRKWITKLYYINSEDCPKITFIKSPFNTEVMEDSDGRNIKNDSILTSISTLRESFKKFMIRLSEEVKFPTTTTRSINQSLPKTHLKNANFSELIGEYSVQCSFDLELSDFEEIIYNLMDSGVGGIYFSDSELFVYPFPSIKEEDIITEVRWTDKKYIIKDNVFLDAEKLIKIDNDTIQIEDILEETNEEVKSGLFKYVEENKDGDFLHRLLEGKLEKVDFYSHDKQGKFRDKDRIKVSDNYTLYKGQGLAFVECFCPSTGRKFMLEVESKFDNVKDAIASLYQIPNYMKNYIEEIHRQGEIFLTKFTQKGMSKLKERNNWYVYSTCITGEEYFKKLCYER